MYKSGENPSYAFNLIIRKHQEKLYYFIRRITNDHEDTNDVLQNVFIKAYKGIGNFREESNLYTWLYRIASNESITFINKKKKTKGHLPLEDEVGNHYGSTHHGHGPTGEEIQKKLEEAIETLPPKQRTVFTLKYFEEKKYEEMAIILDSSVGSLKASYFHAVRKIENYLTED